MPVALLEVLVCKTAQLVYNHSDLINDVCRIMDTYQVGLRDVLPSQYGAACN